jgi:dihydrolipoamide dehydrogenase
VFQMKVMVIGGGPGGYSCAIKLSALGAEVSLVEKDALGGTCLLRGCIPTKAMIQSAKVAHTVKSAEVFGIRATGFDVDFSKVLERKNQIVNTLQEGISFLIQKNKVEWIKGTASFLDRQTVSILRPDGGTSTHTADYFVIATGSVPSIPPLPGADLPGLYTSDSILEMDALPSSITIIGGGFIGMEWASILNAMGTTVTVLEMAPSILGNVEPDIAKRALPIFKKQGIEIHTGAMVESIRKASDGYHIDAKTKTGPMAFLSEKVLFATGRRPHTKSLGLAHIGLPSDNQPILVDENARTSAQNIYAIGDVTGTTMLAHWAYYMGDIAAHHITHPTTKKTRQAVVPSCIFTFPEIAWAGLSEAEAKEKGIPTKSAKVLFSGNGKALCLGEKEGFVKVVAREDDHEILGVHIMGPHASDLIAEGVLALEKKMCTHEFSQIIHAHPTLSEVVADAFMAIEGMGHGS